jgi:hypothetical protein
VQALVHGDDLRALRAVTMAAYVSYLPYVLIAIGVGLLFWLWQAK